MTNTISEKNSNNRGIPFLLSVSQRNLSIAYLFVFILLWILIQTVPTFSQEWYWSGPQESIYTWLGGWSPSMRLPILFFGVLSSVMMCVGKRVLSFVFSIIHFIIMTIIAVAGIKYCNLEYGAYLIAFLTVLHISIATVYLFHHPKQYELSFVLSMRNTVLCVLCSIFSVLSYIFMNAFLCVYNNELLSTGNNEFGYNFTSAFYGDVVYLNPYDALLFALLVLLSVIVWQKKYKIQFIVSNIFFAAFLVGFFYTLDYWARTGYFLVLSIFSILTYIMSVFLFCLNRLDSPKDVSEKIEKLNLMKNNGVLNEEEYQRRMTKITKTNK